MAEPESDDRDLVVKDALYFEDVRAALGRGAPTVIFGTSSRTLDRGIARIAAAQTRRPQQDGVRASAATEAPRVRQPRGLRVRYGGWLAIAVISCILSGLVASALVWHWVSALLVLGTLLGVFAGGAICVRYLRQEVASDITPMLRRVQLQLDNLQAEINLDLATRLGEMGTHPKITREGEP